MTGLLDRGGCGRVGAAAVAIAVIALLVAGCSKNDVPTAPSSGPFTDVFSSQIGVGGSATRAFTVSSTGTVSLTLTSVSPQPTIQVGIGVGIPNAPGTGCNLTRAVVTGPSSSPQLTITADGGTYCVRVYDVGNLTGDTSFSVSVLHP